MYALAWSYKLHSRSYLGSWLPVEAPFPQGLPLLLEALRLLEPEHVSSLLIAVFFRIRFAQPTTAAVSRGRGEHDPATDAEGRSAHVTGSALQTTEATSIGCQQKAHVAFDTASLRDNASSSW